MTIGERIKETRKAKGLTLKQLGEKMNLTASTISDCENDRRKLKPETIKRFADALDTTYEFLSGQKPVPRGHWESAILNGKRYGDICPFCGYLHGEYELFRDGSKMLAATNFCPSCGADLGTGGTSC